ncbi:MAG: BrxA family protein [Bacteroidales bacterium]
MKINTDINILGGMPDMNLIRLFLNSSKAELDREGGQQSYTAIKTDKSVKRFEKAINNTLLRFRNAKSELLVRSILDAESIAPDSLIMLFWNASFNNELLHYLNDNVYFPAYYSGRITVKMDEVSACLMELKLSEPALQKWSDYTIEKVSSKYLTLLKKFGLMEGSQNKTILHPYLDDKMLMLFTYWIKAIETKANLLESHWLHYCFSEKKVFVERIMQKKFSRFIQLNYSGDSLKIEPIIPYENIYYAVSQS